MHDREILEAAKFELQKLRRDKPWLTARVIAKRVRQKPELKTLSQNRLYDVLQRHAALGKDHRDIRNSPYPSTRTLETLWAAVGPGFVRDRDVEPPFLLDGGNEAEAHAPAEPAPEEELDEIAEDEADAPDTFFSYRFRDRQTVRAVAERLEAKGHSIWIAGARIVAGQNINDEVIRAMGTADKQVLYLSRHTFDSLWVGKEIIVGAKRDLDQTLVIDGEDRELVGLLVDWMQGNYQSEYSYIADYQGVSEGVALEFQQLLKAYLEDADKRVYLYPEWPEDAPEPHERMRPLDAYPALPG